MPTPDPQFDPLSLVDQLTTRVDAHRGKLNVPLLSNWVREHRITIERRALELESRPWLKQLYDDQAHHMVLRKATQVGGSVWAIISMIQRCIEIPNWRGTVYFFPTKTDVTDFSQTRVGPMIEENQYLRDVIGDIDKAGARQVGTGIVYFRGMKSKTGMKSVPADGIVFDELDEATEDAKAMATERLAASPYKFVYELSNPSIPRYGIDYAYSGAPESGIPGSDQRLWNIKCLGCNNWVSMESEFPKVLGEDDMRVLRPYKKFAKNWRRELTGGTTAVEDMGWYRACPKCDKELNPVIGEWVATRPTIKSPHGYSLSQLYSPTVPPGLLAKLYFSTKMPHHFYNLNVGIAWMPSEDIITPGHVLRFCGDYSNAYEDVGPCTMGVDQGNDLHVVITRPGPALHWRQIIHLGIYKDWEQLDPLMKRFNVRMAVVDRQPEQRNARSFALRHKGKVFLNTYNVHQVGRPKWDEAQLTVNENRTEAIDISRAPFRIPMGQEPDPSPQEPFITLPRDCYEVQEFARHMSALIKKREEADDGTVSYIYVSSTPDHFAHAFVYDNLAWAWDASSESRPNQGGHLQAIGKTRLILDPRRGPSILDQLSKKEKWNDGY